MPWPTASGFRIKKRERIGCRPKRSGNTPAGRAQRRSIRLVTTTTSCTSTVRIREREAIGLIELAHCYQIRLDSTILTGVFTSFVAIFGTRIGTNELRQMTLLAQPPENPE